MATLTLRPSSDLTVNHSKSSGSVGYSMISESAADDDATYIYQTISSTNSDTITSTFGLSATIPQTEFKVTAVRLYVRLKSTSRGSYSSTAKLNIDSATQNLSVSTSYATRSNSNVGSTLVGNTYTASTFPGLSVTVNTTGAKSQAKSNSFEIRITQVYLEIDYELVGEIQPAIYAKRDASWVVYSTVYKKISGVWELQDNLATVIDDTKKYVRGD